GPAEGGAGRGAVPLASPDLWRAGAPPAVTAAAPHEGPAIAGPPAGARAPRADRDVLPASGQAPREARRRLGLPPRHRPAAPASPPSSNSAPRPLSAARKSAISRLFGGGQ